MKSFLYFLALLGLALLCHIAFSQENIGKDPEQTAGYFEGDLIGDDIRNALRNKSSKWPDSTVHYKINKKFEKEQKDYIIRAMQVIQAVSCIRLEKDEIGKGCFRIGSIWHMLFHILGFGHLNNVPNRDDYIRIETANIAEGEESNFQKYSENDVNDFGVEYDYGSIMHFAANAFSKNGEPTIIALNETAGKKMGQRYRLRETDIRKLNFLYKCK